MSAAPADAYLFSFGCALLAVAVVVVVLGADDLRCSVGCIGGLPDCLPFAPIGGGDFGCCAGYFIGSWRGWAGGLGSGLPGANALGSVGTPFVGVGVWGDAGAEPPACTGCSLERLSFGGADEPLEEDEEGFLLPPPPLEAPFPPRWRGIAEVGGERADGCGGWMGGGLKMRGARAR